MRVLVTGNLGFVGSIVVPYLARVEPDIELIGLDSGYFSHLISPHLPIPERYLKYQIYRDLRHISECDLAGVDAIVHLGAISNDPIGVRYEKVTHEINFLATASLASLAFKLGIKRFVFASSCSMYGASEGGPKRESDQLNPLTAYARSKVEVENTLMSISPSNSYVTALRFATACGFSPRLRLDLVLNDFVRSALFSGEILIHSDGSPWRPLIDVEDMARSIHWALFRSDNLADFIAVNVGSNSSNYQVIDIAKAVQQEINDSKITINPEGRPDKRSYRVNFDLYEELAPNHLPQISLNESIKRLKTGITEWDGLLVNGGFERAIRLSSLESNVRRGFLDSGLSWMV